MKMGMMRSETKANSEWQMADGRWQMAKLKELHGYNVTWVTSGQGNEEIRNESEAKLNELKGLNG